MRKPLAGRVTAKVAGGLTEAATPHAGVVLLVEVSRQSGVMATAERVLPAKRSEKGLVEGELVEAFILTPIGWQATDKWLDIMGSTTRLGSVCE